MSENNLKKQSKLAKEAALKLANLDTKTKNEALSEIAKQLKKRSKEIIKENKKDLETAVKTKLSKPLVKRLKIDNQKMNEIVKEIESVAKLKDPVGKLISQIELDKGLMLYQTTCPIGVIGAIFESRPDALTQISALCLKSGNAVILKGGSEAANTNRILSKIISKTAAKCGLPKGAIQFIETREQVSKMLKLDKYIDLVIPRGSNSFVKFVKDNTKIPVLGHADGVCHIYVDKLANLKKAIEICIDSKCQYPAACNAIETILVHKNIASKFIPLIVKKLKEEGVEIRGDKKTLKIIKTIKNATEFDWSTEYNDLMVSIRTVDKIQEAIDHINKYGSKHTDSIITENKEDANKFMDLVDSSSVMWNASTRFADGFRYGKGAEVGISTGKIHTRGPVGLDGLVIYKYRIIGNGQVVKDYVGQNAKNFIHKVIK
jgi:glutamate-5-semialdehyde dehydrogenase